MSQEEVEVLEMALAAWRSIVDGNVCALASDPKEQLLVVVCRGESAEMLRNAVKDVVGFPKPVTPRGLPQ